MDSKIYNLIDSADTKNPLYLAKTSNLEYYNDFMETLQQLLSNKKLKQKEILNFLENRLQLKHNYSQSQYLQSASELTVLNYFIKNYSKTFIYEPKFSGNKNPECSFKIDKIEFNIEVKCPDMQDIWAAKKRNTLKYRTMNRIPNHKQKIEEINKIIIPGIEGSKYDELEPIKRQDNKMKNYLENANTKFPTSSDNNFNLLVVGLSELNEMDEWHTYLYDGKNGFFTDGSYSDPQKYANVDGVVISNVMKGHKEYLSNDYKNSWIMDSYLNIAIYNNLKGLGETKKWFIYNKYIYSMFGKDTNTFFNFLKKCDEDEQKHSTADNGINWIDKQLKLHSLITLCFKDQYS